MKQADNNEMDLLLRALGRRGPGGLSARRGSGDEVGGFTEHLDPDELNAFAEGMVPDRARARYTQHIADCANCRSIVVTLTQAAGTSMRTTALSENVGSSFWHKLAAFFSPPVLRYAVPAVVVAAVIGISFLALREPQSSDFVAQHQPSNPAISGEPNLVATPSAYSSAEAPDAAQKSVQSPANETNRDKKDQPDDGSTLDQTAGTTTATTVAGLSAAKDSAQPGASSTGESKPSFAPEPQAPAAPPPRPATSEADKLSIARKEEPAEAQAAQRRRGEDYTAQSRDEVESNRAATPKSAASPASPGRVQGLMAENRAYDSKNKRDSAGESETRSVSGRQFRRQGNAWVDTAYESSRATTNIRRGSEQYRALIADEPGIRTIAEQLGGEVVVVWKSRAYRIR